jgi:hypothetical protein
VPVRCRFSLRRHAGLGGEKPPIAPTAHPAPGPALLVLHDPEAAQRVWMRIGIGGDHRSGWAGAGTATGSSTNGGTSLLRRALPRCSLRFRSGRRAAAARRRCRHASQATSSLGGELSGEFREPCSISGGAQSASCGGNSQRRFFVLISITPEIAKMSCARFVGVFRIEGPLRKRLGHRRDGARHVLEVVTALALAPLTEISSMHAASVYSYGEIRWLEHLYLPHMN